MSKRKLDAVSNGSAKMPLKKEKLVHKYETFITPEDLEDLIHVKWNSMNVIDDDDEVEIVLDLPDIIPVTIKSKNRKEARTVYRKLNGSKKKL